MTPDKSIAIGMDARKWEDIVDIKYSTPYPYRIHISLENLQHDPKEPSVAFPLCAVDIHRMRATKEVMCENMGIEKANDAKHIMLRPEGE